MPGKEDEMVHEIKLERKFYVRHGKWVGEDGKPKEDSFSVYCSACGKWSEYRTRYCGECGAKMDEE